jgi:hypothetical protein
MIAMQKLQPQLKEIQKKYKDDREKMGQEMMKLYKENKVSPLGGCLPGCRRPVEDMRITDLIALGQGFCHNLTYSNIPSSGGIVSPGCKGMAS